MFIYGSHNSQNYCDYFPTLSHSAAHVFNTVRLRTPIQDPMQSRVSDTRSHAGHNVQFGTPLQSNVSDSRSHAVQRVRLKVPSSSQCQIQDSMRPHSSTQGPTHFTMSNSGPHAVHNVRLKAPSSPHCPTQGPKQSTMSDSRPQAVHTVRLKAPCSPQCPIQGTISPQFRTWSSPPCLAHDPM